MVDFLAPPALRAAALIWAVALLPPGVAAHGQDAAAADLRARMHEQLVAGGVTGNRLEAVLGGAMIRILLEIRSEGEAFELDPRMREHLVELGLSAAQLHRIVELAHQALATTSESSGTTR